jgi:predicted nucleic acid-binding Zn ribbon protein
LAQLSISEALKQMLNSSPWKARYMQSRVRLEWETLMGKTIARYTEEVKLIEHTLVIKTQVAALKNELQFNKNIIIQKVNEHLGETIVKEVIIT